MIRRSFLATIAVALGLRKKLNADDCEAYSFGPHPVHQPLIKESTWEQWKPHRVGIITEVHPEVQAWMNLVDAHKELPAALAHRRLNLFYKWAVQGNWPVNARWSE